VNEILDTSSSIKSAPLSENNKKIVNIEDLNRNFSTKNRSQFKNLTADKSKLRESAKKLSK
jgi:hypothetical protein